MGYGRFLGSVYKRCTWGIRGEFPQVFRLVWDGYGKRIPSAAFDIYTAHYEYITGTDSVLEVTTLWSYINQFIIIIIIIIIILL